jgi:hypothetical protein
VGGGVAVGGERVGAGPCPGITRETRGTGGGGGGGGGGGEGGRCVGLTLPPSCAGCLKSLNLIIVIV